MSTSDADAETRRYLHDLDRALRGVPAARRRELLSDIEAHIREEQTERGPGATPMILEELGEPEAIAAEARERSGVRRARPGLTETAALILLPIGGVVLPLIGWVVGVVLLWSSAVWSTREKLIGTFVVPGGLMTALYATFFGMNIESCTSGRGQAETCTGGGGTAVGDVLFLVLLLLLVLAPIGSAIYLARARRQAAAAAAA